MEKTFKLEVTEAELNLIGMAVGRLPFEQVAGLVANLNKQIQEQEKNGE